MHDIIKTRLLLMVS